jgi:membrane protein
VLNLAISFGVIVLLFAALFKVLPDAKISWSNVWVGATVTAALFVVGKFLIGLYIGQSNPGQAYGAAGSLAVLLLWVYYSALIVLFGAEFTETWAEQRGEGVEPEPGAVRVGQEKPLTA